jgi:hypothetical protein
MNIPILRNPITHWECERCPALDQTNVAGVHTRFHRCAALGGAELPMIVRGSGARVILREREDYVGAERVQLIEVDGKARPVMAAVTERPDGSNDTVVYAPVATGRGEAR